MKHNLDGLKIAILVTDGFEFSEMTEPKKALDQAGAKTFIISNKKGKIKSWQAKNWGEEFTVDRDVTQTNVNEFDALVLPGGVISPDSLRMDQNVINFVKGFVKSGKVIAAICHGPWTLINAEAVRGKTITSWPSLRIDLTNAGANWVDRDVVVDGNLITSRKPDDIPAFNKALIEALSHLHTGV